MNTDVAELSLAAALAFLIEEFGMSRQQARSWIQRSGLTPQEMTKARIRDEVKRKRAATRRRLAQYRAAPVDEPTTDDDYDFGL